MLLISSSASASLLLAAYFLLRTSMRNGLLCMGRVHGVHALLRMHKNAASENRQYTVTRHARTHNVHHNICCIAVPHTELCAAAL
jgi:hypothetical protein